MNGLRFIAASLVLFTHSLVFLRQQNSKLYSNPAWSFLTQNGGNAVSFFFVLSGFLISYLLITEFEQTNTIVVKRFYVRRLLRIWPIYYLLIVLNQFIFPYVFQLIEHPYKQISTLPTFFYLTFLPNIPYALWVGEKGIIHLWSIGVEEQFYLIWAPVFKAVKRNFPKICLIIIVSKVFIFYALYWCRDIFPNESFESIRRFFTDFAIEKMAIGGLGAYLFFHFKTKLMRLYIFSIPMQLLFIGALFFYLCFDVKTISDPVFRSLYHILFGNELSKVIFIPLLFLYLIINISSNPVSIISTENSWLNYLGKISYGLYIYHMISLSIADALLLNLKIQSGILSDVIFFVMTFSINIMIASLSYRYIESRLLTLRNR